MTRCTFCRFSVKPQDEAVTCRSCGCTLHRGCWIRNGGCTRFGCEEAAVADKPAVTQTVSRGWGDEKKCPACAADIPSSSMLCRYCKARFPYADPMTSLEHECWKTAEVVKARHRRLMYALFTAAILGATGPVVAPAAYYCTRRWREEFVGEYAGLFALGYGTTVLGTLYSIVMLLLLLGR